MESERKIEKLLRAYAKNRRAQTGDPLKLSPATRKFLQDEIVRNANGPEDEEASISLWELFRQQWAFLLGFALVIFFVASLFLPALSSAKKKSQTVAAPNNFTLGSPNAFKNTVAPAKAVPVLENFRVQQNGGTIRVVDADGSVYDGSLQPEIAGAQNGPAPAATPVPPIAPATKVEPAKIQTNGDESQSPTKYFFRVTGTNQTLKQKVVFTGNVLAGGGATANLRIQGTAEIAGTTNILIDAVPLSP